MNLPADFPDRLSPMLVKELRQGMRTNMFTVSFILLQAFMVLCLIFGAVAGADGADVSWFFWTFIGVALIGVMPLRGFGALHNETKINTMDLIQMTRLSAWRITFGKWLALMSQSVLLVAAVLPYIVLRYYLGGVDLLAEILVLLSMCLASMVLTALTVGFSAFPSMLLRGIIAGGILLVLFSSGMNVIMFTAMSGSMRSGAISFSLSGPSGLQLLGTIAAILITAAYTIYFFLDLGASRIAPEAANHATRKRLIGLGFVAICFLLPHLGKDFAAMMVLGTIALAVVWIDALTEKATMVPSIFRPFVRRPLLKPSMYLLTPGWHTALWFVLLSAALVIGLAALTPQFNPGYGRNDVFDEDFQFFVINLLSSLLFPLVIIHLFFYPVTFSKFYFGLYLLVQLCIGIVTLMVSVVSSANDALRDLLYYCIPLPPVMMVGWEARTGVPEAYFFTASIAMLVLTIVIPLARSFPLFRRVHQLSRDIVLETEAATASQATPSTAGADAAGADFDSEKTNPGSPSAES